MTDEARTAVQTLRGQVAALLSQLDTAAPPVPDEVRSKADDHPGCEWRPVRGWRLFTTETNPDDATCVYLDQDNGYSLPGDWEAFSIEVARKVGMAFLAAAERAEAVLAEVAGGPRAPTLLPRREPG